jgi:hypothetical protein
LVAADTAQPAGAEPGLRLRGRAQTVMVARAREGARQRDGRITQRGL